MGEKEAERFGATAPDGQVQPSRLPAESGGAFEIVWCEGKKTKSKLVQKTELIKEIERTLEHVPEIAVQLPLNRYLYAYIDREKWRELKETGSARLTITAFPFPSIYSFAASNEEVIR